MATKTEVAHTPGPWSYNGHVDHCDVGREYHEITGAEGFEIINQNGLITSEDDARLIAAAPAQHEALKLVLMFYASPPWTDAEREEWERITGSRDATTRVMCDHIRKVVARATEAGSAAEAS